jgi:uroporphyrin-III C-methyltransferase
MIMKKTSQTKSEQRLTINDQRLTNNEPTKGFVSLISAGPGDPELLTIKASRAIQRADVLLVDRLVSPEIVSAYAQPHAIIMEVGKQCRQNRSTPQKTINELIVEYALQGLNVARIKGGDVSIFSNVLDELQACAAHGIKYELIPGVTSALGAAAYSGFPLTARGFSVGVRLLTFYKNDIIPHNYWSDLANTNDTLVFYMSSEVMNTVFENLIQNGISDKVSVAVVEQATTPNQQTHVFNIYDYKENQRAYYASPTLLIIGKVVNLHHEFKWLENGQNDAEYFKPVDNEFIQTSKHA